MVVEEGDVERGVPSRMDHPKSELLQLIGLLLFKICCIVEVFDFCGRGGALQGLGKGKWKLGERWWNGEKSKRDSDQES